MQIRHLHRNSAHSIPHTLTKFILNPRRVSGRVNQVSHLRMELHSDAECFVADDSDCVCTTPVTPDVLFGEGKLLIPHSKLFQKDASKVDV